MAQETALHPADPVITALLIIILAPDNTGSIEVIFSYPQMPAKNTGPDLGPCVSLNAHLISRLPAPMVSWTPRWHSQNGPTAATSSLWPPSAAPSSRTGNPSHPRGVHSRMSQGHLEG